jgi:hypothetical protein
MPPFAPSRGDPAGAYSAGSPRGRNPLLWNEFNKARQPDVVLVPDIAYGVVVSGNRDHFDCFCGVGFLPGSQLPETLRRLSFPPGGTRYSAMSHVSELRTTMGRIFGDWLPASGFAVEGPSSFFDERPFACPHLNWGMHRGRRCRVPSFPRVGGLFLS